MNDAQQIGELRNLHNRCDDLTVALSTLTQAVSEDILRTRAYENIINGSWLLNRFFSQRRIVKEMNRIDGAEGKLRVTQADREHRAVINQKVEQAKAKLEANAQKRVDKREKQLTRELKKNGVPA